MTAQTLGISGDHEELAELAQDFANFAGKGDVDPRTDEAGYTAGQYPNSWEGLLDTGLHSVHIGEEYGGGGAGIVELAVVLEQLGAGLYPGPLLATVSASAVTNEMVHQPSDARGVAQELLARFAGGATGAVLTGDEIRAEAHADDFRIVGQARRVLGALAAEVFLVAAHDGNEVRWVALPREAVEVRQDESVDLTRDLGTVAVDTVVAKSDYLPSLDVGVARALISTLRAADAAGIAAAVTKKAVEHAKLRTQFRRPLASFQALQQRLSLMYVQSEIIRGIVWDMARSSAQGRVELMRAGAAGALSRALTNTFEYVMTLGAIGFTWEHDAQLYWRRVLQLGVLEGPQALREHEQGIRALAKRIDVRVADPDDLPELRQEVRDALMVAGDPNDGIIPGSPWAPRRNSAWQAFLAEQKLVASHLPEPYGRNADALTQAVIHEEFTQAELSPPSLVIGDWVAPTIAEHGTEEQKDRFLPPTLRGDIIWCQLFSEPGAGSDLGSVATKAERVEGGWRVTGQKIWNSLADVADWGALLVRTDPDQAGSRGLSYFLVDMASPGVEVRPIKQATGIAEFCEVFLDDVFVSDDQVIGAPQQGWKIATTTLSNERLRMGEELSHGAAHRFRTLINGMEEGTPLWHEAVTALGRAVAREYALNALGARGAMKRISGGDISSETSVLKLANIFAQREGAEELIRLAGPAQIIETNISDGVDHGTLMDYLGLPAVLLGGGTPDIQLGVIAHRLLGLR